MANRSSALPNKIFRDYPHWRSVEDFVEGVRALNPALVLLFGSLARGEFTQYSDADVLLVFDEPTDWLDVYRHSDGWVQPLVKTWQEIQGQLAQGEPFWCEVVADGIVLYDSNGAHRRIKHLAQKSQARFGLVRTENGWQWTGGRE